MPRAALEQIGHLDDGFFLFFEETGKVRSTSRIVTQQDRVIGFNMLGRRWDHSVFIEWIEQRRTLGWVLRHLNEAAFDTEFVPPLRLPRS